MKRTLNTLLLFFTICGNRYINTDNIAYIRIPRSSLVYGSMIYFASADVPPIFVSNKNPKEVWEMLVANKVR